MFSPPPQNEFPHAVVKPTGISYAGDGFSQERVERFQLRLSSTATLAALSEEFAVYTLALIYRHVPLGGREPYHDFCREYGRPAPEYTAAFDKPLFRGLEAGNDYQWNHVLFFMSREHWPAYKRFLGQLAFHDRGQQLLQRVRTQELRLPDALAIAGLSVLPETLPVVPATAFVLDTNRGCHYFKQLPPPLLTPVAVFEETVLPETAFFSNAVVRDAHENPYGEVDARLGVPPPHIITPDIGCANANSDSPSAFRDPRPAAGAVGRWLVRRRRGDR